jgi:class 3 adenylate cyclase/CHASE2 domain-containing sensor protein
MTVRGSARRAALLLAGLIVGAVAFNGPLFGTENFLERWFIDIRFFIISHMRAHDAVSDRVAVILMDTASEKSLGVPYGIRWRQFYPDLTAALGRAGASLVVFDAMFYERDPERDPALTSAFSRAGNVIAAEDGSLATEKSIRASLIGVGSIRIPPLGGEPRRIVPTGNDAAAPQPLSLVAAAEYARRTRTAEPAAVFRSRSGFWIDYRDSPEYFPCFSLSNVLRPSEGRVSDVFTGINYPASVFSGRIVFVGRDEGESSRNDRFAFPNSLGRTYPGVFGHAYAAETILGNRSITRSPAWIDAAVTLLFLALLLLMLGIRPRAVRTMALVLLPTAVFLLFAVLLSRFGIWLGYAPLFTAFWCALVVHWVLLRISLSASLSRAMGFDPALIEAFRRERARSGGQVSKDVAILIADVRDYTRYVSSNDSETVSRVMAEYMEAMERRITAEGGYINKYVGDEIVAVFGFPLSGEQLGRRAVRAALGMLEELQLLVASWRERHLSSIERIGIGIDVGTVSFAEVGGKTRSQFDIIGNCINGASRIEHLTKDLKRALLISRETWAALEGDDSLVGVFELRKREAIRGQGEREIFAMVK